MRPQSFLPGLILALAALSAVAPATASASPEFDIDTIAGAVAGQTAVAYDSSGDLCVAFIDRPSFSNRLLFAHGGPGNWTVSVVDSDVGASLSLAIASNGTPYISYYYEPTADLRLASRPGTTWGHVTVDATGTVGSWSSLALDSSSRPVISYYGQGHLKVAAYNGTSFTITTVDATNSTVGLYTSLKLYGTSNTRCVSYYDAANGDLKYATNPGGTWTITTVDSAGDVGVWSSLGLRVYSGTAYPRISYYDATNTALKQASYSGSTWSQQTVDNSADVGQMAVTYGVSVAYWDATNQAVKFAYGGTTWTLHVVEPGVVGRNPSLVNDSSGVVHLVYVANGTELRHAAGTRLWYDATASTGSLSGPFRGAAWGDYDNDSWPDLYLPAYGASSRLLRNTIGSFQDVSAAPLNTSSAWAAQWADYDNDGDLDLAVAGGPMMNLLCRNSGAAGGYAFTDVLGRSASESTDDVAWVDENADGAVDLLLSDYTLPNKLLRNQDAAGGWDFTDVASGSLLSVGATAGARVGAFTQDGIFRLAMVKPQPGAGVKVLVHEYTGQFTDGPAVTPGGYPASVAWGDYNGDGAQDLLVCRAQSGDPTSTAVLYRNDGSAFTRMSVPALEIPALSAAWGDVDNDGDLDVFVGGYGVACRLLRNDSSTTTTVFTDVTPTALAVSGTIRGIAFADHDKDGDLDFFVAADGSTSRLFRNDLRNDSHWLEIKLQGVGSNRSGLGARVVVSAGGRSQSLEVGGGSAAHSQNLLTLHCGLGSATVADYVTVYWPRNGGETQRFSNVAVDQILEIEEPQTFTRTDLLSLPSGIGFEGLAWGDKDADGDPDLATTSRGYLSSGPVLVFRNDAGVIAHDESPGDIAGQGVAWGDYDNDNYPELALGGNSSMLEVLQNHGNYIEPIDTYLRPPFDLLGTWTGVTWFDQDNDGRLDLYATNSEQSFFPASANVLYRATSDFWFTTAVGTGLEIGGLSENAVCGDYDGDGDPDVLVLKLSSAYYPGSCMLMRNDGGTFTQVAAGAFNAITAVAAAWGDYDNDRDLDVAIGQKLLRNDGGGAFTEVTAAPDIYGGYTVAWADYDLDGDLDLSRGGELLRNDGGGVFVLDHDLCSNASGGEWADWDRDGDPDLALGGGRSLILLRNDQENGNHWFQVDLRGRTVNAMAIGTRVRIVAGGTSQIREVSGGSGYYSQPEAVLSFGLGAATQVDSVVVRWTNGTVTTLTPATRNLAADQRLLVYEQIGPSPAPGLPKVLALAAPWPNPANPSVSLRFELPAATTVRLSVYDVAGRLVAEPVAGDTREAGVHTVRWDGRARDGNPAASGLYILRLETALGTRSARLLLVR